MSVDLSKPRSSVERAYSSASSTTSSRRSGRRKRRRMKHTVMPLKRRSNKNEVACDVHRVSNLDIEEMEQSACFWVAKNIDDPSERSFKEDIFINKDQDSSADDELSCAEDFSTFDESIDLMSEEARDQSEYINEDVEKENDANYANEKKGKFVYKNEDNDANYSEEKMFYGVRKGKVDQTDNLQRVTPVPLPRKKLRMSDCSDDGQSGFSSEGTGMHVGWTSDVVSSGAEYNESDGEGERKKSGLNSKEFYGYRKDNGRLAEFPTRKIRQQHADEDTDLVVVAKDITITESKHVSDSNHPKDVGIDYDSHQTDNIDENSNYPSIDDKDEFKRRHENSRYDLQPYLSSEKNRASSDTELVNFQSFDEVERWSDKSLPLGGHKTKTQYYSVEDLIKASQEEDLKEADMGGEGPEIPRIGAYENYQPPRDTRKIDGENDVPTFENEQPEIIPNALNTQVTENRNLQENESKVIPADAYPVKYIEKEQHDSNAYLYEESKIFFGYRRKEEVNEADNQVTEETSVHNHQDNVNSYPSKDSYTTSEYELHGPTGDEQFRNQETNNPKSIPDDDSKYEENKGFDKGKQEGSHRRDQSDDVYQHRDQTTRDDSKIWHETKEFYGFRKTASVESLSYVDNQGQTQKWEQNQEFYGFKQSKTGEEFASPQYKTQGSGDNPTNIFTESREFYGFRRFGSSENVSKRGGEGQLWEESREFYGFRRKKIVDDQTHFAASEQLKKPQSFHQKVDTKPLYLEEAKNGSSDRKRLHENNRPYDERIKENQPNDTKSHEQQSYGPNEKQPRQEPVMKSTEQENLMFVDDSRDLEESLEFPHYTRPEDLPRSAAYEQYARPVTPLQEEPMPDPMHDEGQDDKDETVKDAPTETTLTESLPTQQSRDTIQQSRDTIQQSRDTIQREVSKTEEGTPNSESSDVGLKMFRQRSLQRNDRKSRFSEEIGKRADKTGMTEPIAARANKLKETTRKTDTITKRSAIEKKNVEELVSVFNTLENVQKTTENSKTVDTKTSNNLGKNDNNPSSRTSIFKKRNDDILDSVDQNIQDEEAQKTLESVQEPETTDDDQDKQEEDVVVKREEVPVEAFVHEKPKQFPKYRKLIPYRKPRSYDSRRSRDDDDEVYRAEIRKSREDSWNQRRKSSKKNSGSKSDGEIEGFKTTFRKRVITPGTPVNIRLYGLNLQKTDQKKVFDVDWDLVDNTQTMVNENVEQTLLEKESVDFEEISDERVPVNEMMNPTEVTKSTFYLEQIPGNESVINDPYVEKHSFVIPGTDGDLSYTLPEQQKPIYLSEQQLPKKRENLPTEDNRSDIEIPIKKLHETELLKKQDSLNVDIEYDGQEKGESEIPGDNVFYEKSSLRSSTPRNKKQPSMRNEDFINGDKNYSTHEESSERYESTSHDTSDGVDTTIHTTRTTKTTRTETTETTVKTIRKSGGSQSRPSMESDETCVEIETFDATNGKDETDSRAVNDQSTKGRSVESELDYDKNKCDEPYEVSTDIIMENGTSEPVNVTSLGRIDNNEDNQVLQSREDHFLHTRLKMISENKQTNDKKGAKKDKLLEPITIYPDDVDGNNRVTEQLLIPISGNKLNENFEREHTPDIEFLQVDESTLQTRINESVHKSEKPLHSCVRRVSLTDLFERPKPHEPKLEKEDRPSKLMPDFQAVEDSKTPIFENVNSSEKPDVGIEFWEPNTNREMERIEFHPDEDESLETPPSEDVVSLNKTLINEQVFKERTNVATLPNFELQPVNESIVPEIRDDSFEIPKMLNEKTVEPVEEIVLASIHTSKDVSIPDLEESIPEMRPLPTPPIVQENITSEAKEFDFEIPDFPDEVLVEPVKENVVATDPLKNQIYVPDFEEFITVLEPVKPVDENVTFERRESGLNIPEIQTPEPEQRPTQPVTEELTKNDVSIPSFSCEFEETSVEFPNVVMEQDKSFESDLEVEPPEDLSSVSCASYDIGKLNEDFEEDDNDVPVDNDKSLYEKLPPEEKPKDHLPYKDDEFEIETWSETKKTIKETHSTETVKIEKTFTKHGSKTSPKKNSVSSNKESSLSNAAHIPTLSQPKNSGDSSSEPSDRPVDVTSEVLVKRRRSRRGNRFDDIKKSGALVPETVVQDKSPSVKNAKPFEAITVSKQKPLSTEPIFIPKGKSPQLRPEMYLLGSDDDDCPQDVKKLVDSSSPDEKEEISKNSPTDEDESLAKEEISLELYDELLDNEFKGLTEQNEEIGSSNETEVPEMIFEKDLKITTSEKPFEVKENEDQSPLINEDIVKSSVEVKPLLLIDIHDTVKRVNEDDGKWKEDVLDKTKIPLVTPIDLKDVFIINEGTHEKSEGNMPDFEVLSDNEVKESDPKNEREVIIDENDDDVTAVDNEVIKKNGDSPDGVWTIETKTTVETVEVEKKQSDSTVIEIVATKHPIFPQDTQNDPNASPIEDEQDYVIIPTDIVQLNEMIEPTKIETIEAALEDQSVDLEDTSAHSSSFDMTPSLYSVDETTALLVVTKETKPQHYPDSERESSSSIFLKSDTDDDVRKKKQSVLTNVVLDDRQDLTETVVGILDINYDKSDGKELRLDKEINTVSSPALEKGKYDLDEEKSDSEMTLDVDSTTSSDKESTTDEEEQPSKIPESTIETIIVEKTHSQVSTSMTEITTKNIPVYPINAPLKLDDSNDEKEIPIAENIPKMESLLTYGEYPTSDDHPTDDNTLYHDNGNKILTNQKVEMREVDLQTETTKVFDKISQTELTRLTHDASTMITESKLPINNNAVMKTSHGKVDQTTYEDETKTSTTSSEVLRKSSERVPGKTSEKKIQTDAFIENTLPLIPAENQGTQTEDHTDHGECEEITRITKTTTTETWHENCETTTHTRQIPRNDLKTACPVCLQSLERTNYSFIKVKNPSRFVPMEEKFTQTHLEDTDTSAGENFEIYYDEKKSPWFV